MYAERRLGYRGGQRSHRPQGGLGLRTVGRAQADALLPKGRHEAQPRVIQALSQLEQLDAQRLAFLQSVGAQMAPMAWWIVCASVVCSPASLAISMACVASARRRAYSPGVEKLGGQQREHRCAPRIILRKDFHGGLEHLHTLGVDPAGPARESSAVGEHRATKAVGVSKLSGKRRGVEQRLAKPGISALALGLPQTNQQLAALCAQCLALEIERLTIPAHRLLGGESLERPVGRQARVVDRLGGIGTGDCRRPVVGELAQSLTRVIAEALLELLGYLAMNERAARSPRWRY